MSDELQNELIRHRMEINLLKKQILELKEENIELKNKIKELESKYIWMN